MSPAVKRNNMLIKRNKILACIDTPKTVREISEVTQLSENFIQVHLNAMYFENKIQVNRPENPRTKKIPFKYLAIGTPYKLLFDAPKEYDYPKLRPLYFVKAKPSNHGIVKIEDEPVYAKHCKESQALRNAQPVNQQVWIGSSAAML